MTTAALAQDLAARLPETEVLADGSTGAHAVDGVRPALVVLPSTVDEVSRLLQFAGERGLAVAPWGAGTLIDLGNLPQRVDIVLDLARLNAVVEHAPEDLVVTVQAGIALGSLNQRLAAHGQRLSLDPPLAERATAGGALSANVWGPNRLRHGTARDLVIGLTAVLADGSVVHSGGRVVKNVAGYDMNKRYLGAAGSLGVIVEASFKLHPRPPAHSGLIAAFADGERAHATALALVNSYLEPIAVELIGPAAGRRLAKGSGARPPEGSWLVAVLLAGLGAAVERQTREIVRLTEQAGASTIAALESGPRDDLFRRLRDYGRSAEDPAALILRCAVLPSEIPIAVRLIESVVSVEGEAPELIASPGAGNLRAYWSAAPADAALVERLRAELQRLGGTLVVERCPSTLKQRLDVWGIDGPDLGLMRDLKAAFDPRETLNPGRFAGGI